MRAMRRVGFVIALYGILPYKTTCTSRQRQLDVQKFNLGLAAKQRFARTNELDSIERVLASINGYENLHNGPSFYIFKVCAEVFTFSPTRSLKKIEVEL